MIPEKDKRKTYVPAPVAGLALMVVVLAVLVISLGVKAGANTGQQRMAGAVMCAVLTTYNKDMELVQRFWRTGLPWHDNDFTNVPGVSYWAQKRIVLEMQEKRLLSWVPSPFFSSRPGGFRLGRMAMPLLFQPASPPPAPPKPSRFLGIDKASDTGFSVIGMVLPEQRHWVVFSGEVIRQDGMICVGDMCAMSHGDRHEVYHLLVNGVASWLVKSVKSGKIEDALADFVSKTRDAITMEMAGGDGGSA